MYPAKSLRPFIQLNRVQIENMVRSFCRSLNFFEDYSDIIQDLYVKFHIEQIIQRYDSSRKILISTYLYRIIRNFVINYVKEYRRKTQYYNPMLKDYVNFNTIRYFDMAPEYINMLDSNDSPLVPEIRGFEEYLSKSGKNYKFRLDRRKNKNRCEECSILDLFQLMYQGYTVADIAVKFGITKTSVYNIKAKLVDALMEYGIKISANKKFFVIS